MVSISISFENDRFHFSFEHRRVSLLNRYYRVVSHAHAFESIVARAPTCVGIAGEIESITIELLVGDDVGGVEEVKTIVFYAAAVSEIKRLSCTPVRTFPAV